MGKEGRIDALEARLAAVADQTRRGFGERAGALRAAAMRLEAGDGAARDEVRRLAHRLRGVAANAGEDALGLRAAHLEEAAARGRDDDRELVALTRQLADAVARSTEPDERTRPASRETREPTAGPRETARAGSTVIALDDDASTRRLLELSLKHGGFHAVVSGDAAAAMALVLDRSPALVIVDAMMPDVDGLSFYRSVRERAGSTLPVVILSAAAPEELGWDLPDDPRLCWLRKPFRPGALLEQLGRFLDGR